MKTARLRLWIAVSLIALTLAGALVIRGIKHPSISSDDTLHRSPNITRSSIEAENSRDFSTKNGFGLERSTLAISPNGKNSIDPRNPMSSLRGLSGVALKDAKIELIYQIAERSDPATLVSLLDYLKSNESEEIGIHGAISCIPKLFSRGSAEATEWMKSLGDNSMSIRYLSVAATTLGNFSTNDNALTGLLSAPGKSGEWRDTILECYTMAKAEQDPISALKVYFENTQDPKINTVDGIVSRLQGKEQVIEFLGAIKDWPDSLHKQNAEGSAFDAWAQKTPIDAANAAKDLSPQSLSRVMQSWSSSDLNEALQWLNSLQPGQARDSSMIGLSSNLVAVDPSNATALAFSLENENLRKNQTESNFRLWYSHSPAAALKWAQENEYTPP